MDRHRILSIVREPKVDATIIRGDFSTNTTDTIGLEVSNNVSGVLGLFPHEIGRELHEAVLIPRKRGELTSIMTALSVGIQYSVEKRYIEQLMALAYERIAGRTKIPPNNLKKTLAYLGLLPEEVSQKWRRREVREIDTAALLKKIEFVLRALKTTEGTFS